MKSREGQQCVDPLAAALQLPHATYHPKVTMESSSWLLSLFLLLLAASSPGAVVTTSGTRP